MALGERFRSGGARGIARFLADHQHCDAGFDVRRDEAGSGRLRIACLGCGQGVDYRAAEAGELAAGLPVTTAENGELEDRSEPSGAAPPTVLSDPIPRPPFGRRGRVAMPPGLRQRRPVPQSRRRVPRWVSAVVIGALIIGGLTMVAIGVLSDDGEQAGTPTQPESDRGEAAEGTATAPDGQGAADAEPNTPQGGGGAAEEQGAGTRQQGGSQSDGNASSAPGAQAAALERRRFARRFAIGVPPAWERDARGGAIVLTAPGATAELNVFFESGGRPHRQLARAANGFLAQRHRGAELEKWRPMRIGPRRGLRVRVTYPGGEEVAVVLSAKGFSYLVLRRVDRGAPDDIGQQAEAALASFRPL